MLSLPVLLYTQISIHAPRTGSDTAPHQQTRRHPAFQSTLPARGATCATAFSIVLTVYFNPRSPHGERRAVLSQNRVRPVFQSTLPARGATQRPARAASRQQFQPTLPARGATLEGDSRDRGPGHFNPRSPHGERPTIQRYTEYLGEFQPTLPARGATA